jgi:hypothetical protein
LNISTISGEWKSDLMSFLKNHRNIAVSKICKVNFLEHLFCSFILSNDVYVGNVFLCVGWNRVLVAYVGLKCTLENSMNMQCVTYVTQVLSISIFAFRTYNEKHCNSMNKNVSFPYITHASVGLCSVERKGICFEFPWSLFTADFHTK